MALYGREPYERYLGEPLLRMLVSYYSLRKLRPFYLEQGPFTRDLSSCTTCLMNQDFCFHNQDRTRAGNLGEKYNDVEENLKDTENETSQAWINHSFLAQRSPPKPFRHLDKKNGITQCTLYLGRHLSNALKPHLFLLLPLYHMQIPRTAYMRLAVLLSSPTRITPKTKTINSDYQQSPNCTPLMTFTPLNLTLLVFFPQQNLRYRHITRICIMTKASNVCTSMILNISIQVLLFHLPELLLVPILAWTR